MSKKVMRHAAKNLADYHDGSPPRRSLPSLRGNAGLGAAGGEPLKSLVGGDIRAIPRPASWVSQRQPRERPLRAALDARDVARLTDLAERMYALGNPYGFRKITTLGRQLRDAAPRTGRMLPGSSLLNTVCIYYRRSWWWKWTPPSSGPSGRNEQARGAPRPQSQPQNGAAHSGVELRACEAPAAAPPAPIAAPRSRPPARRRSSLR